MADPDLQITWVRGGPGPLNPAIRGGVGDGLNEVFFGPLGLSWSKNKEGGNFRIP